MDTQIVIDQAGKVLLQHSEAIAVIDERLDRITRHLEVHSLLIDDLIRHKDRSHDADPPV